MKIYANANGDWWTGEESGIVEISEADLRLALAAEGYAPEDIHNWEGLDKLEQVIWQYGKAAI